MTINFKKYILLLLLLYTVKYYSQKEQKPNIIYIYADDMGYGEIEPYGQKKIKTPHLVELAKQGMTFTQHYTSMPEYACMCSSPSHAYDRKTWRSFLYQR
ncbi:sulfatase-like hydrolase/transferase [Elizabethkingia miricola]|uniref:sulfatase-like hydrolase/transferase n=1 Tax=Elizabethkingia miricola TaxID=172045 RepID=UPI001C88CD52|nr:sulfatase-like hydrolase/transferase [Elizabethkingia miricola]